MNQTHIAFINMMNQRDKEVNGLYHDHAVKYGLTDVTMWIYYTLYVTAEPQTQSDICTYWYYSRQTINTALKAMEAAGDVRLEPVPGNRKSKRVVLTDSGMVKAQQMVTPLIKAESRVLDTFSDQEKEVYAEVLHRRCALLRQYLKEGE